MSRAQKCVARPSRRHTGISTRGRHTGISTRGRHTGILTRMAPTWVRNLGCRESITLRCAYLVDPFCEKSTPYAAASRAREQRSVAGGSRTATSATPQMRQATLCNLARALSLHSKREFRDSEHLHRHGILDNPCETGRKGDRISCDNTYKSRIEVQCRSSTP